jgi:integrase
VGFLASAILVNKPFDTRSDTCYTQVSELTPARSNERVSVTPPTLLNAKGGIMPQSTTNEIAAKPRPDFPLFPHKTGRWAKKVKGAMLYFGPTANDPKGEKALAVWLEEKDYCLSHGKRPQKTSAGMTIRELCDRFLVNRRGKMESHELTLVSFQDYFQTCKRIIDAFGAHCLVSDLDPTDFERFRHSMAKGWSPVTLANEIQRVRVVFRYATENSFVAGPIRYGSEFKKPSKKVLRTNRAAKGPRMFEAKELRTIIDKASVPMKAMILLGINCGLGNSDVANLTISAVDFKTGWLDYPRPKTGIARRCPLWKETTQAIKAAIEERPKVKDQTSADLVFVTKYGRKWAAAALSEPDPDTGKVKNWCSDPVTAEFSKLLVMLGLKRPGLSFYAMRHTFETVGGDSRDQVAVDAIMGHVRDDMASLYRERIGDDRLQAVVDYVHTWLFPAPTKPKAGSAKRSPVASRKSSRGAGPKPEANQAAK